MLASSGEEQIFVSNFDSIPNLVRFVTAEAKIIGIARKQFPFSGIVLELGFTQQ
jgi:hypothetical protein